MLVKRLGRERRRAPAAVLAALGFKLFYPAMAALMALFSTPDPELVRRHAFTERRWFGNRWLGNWTSDSTPPALTKHR
jgi:hypothetical protein